VKVLGLTLLLLTLGVANAQQLPNAASSSRDITFAASAVDAPPAPGHTKVSTRGDRSYGVVADKQFWAVTGLMTGSTITVSELAGRCEGTGGCKFMGPFNSRKKTYALGVPANFGMMELTYRLKRSGKRYWFVPAVAATAANTFVAVHAANRIR